jgi:hypothetical protein
LCLWHSIFRIPFFHIEAQIASPQVVVSVSLNTKDGYHESHSRRHGYKKVGPLVLGLRWKFGSQPQVANRLSFPGSGFPSRDIVGFFVVPFFDNPAATMASKFLLAALLLAPSVLGQALQGEATNVAARDERAAVAFVRSPKLARFDFIV